jgi:hypothetical protein
MPFGVDLALPQVGGSARKTNKDYTKVILMHLPFFSTRAFTFHSVTFVS